MKDIEGEIDYYPIGLGFWGITDQQGRKWRPEQLPKALQRKKLRIKAQVAELPEQTSIDMWGTAVRIEKYELLE